MTLAEFILARLAEIESESRLPEFVRAQGAYMSYRQRNECQMKRQIVSLHTGAHVCPSGNGYGCTDYGDEEDWTEECPTLRLIGEQYSNHPDYGEHWRP